MPPVPTGNPIVGAALRRTYHTSELYNTFQLNSQLTYGPGFDKRHGTRVSPILAHKPYPWGTVRAWRRPAVLHGVQWLDQVANGK